MSDAPKKHRKWWKFAAVAGVVLGTACHALPPQYQEPCRAAAHVISICTGGQ